MTHLDKGNGCGCKTSVKLLITQTFYLGPIIVRRPRSQGIFSPVPWNEREDDPGDGEQG